MITSGLFTSKTDEWATPQDLFDSLHAEFHFNIDVCATPENAKCKTYFTKEEDGLSKDWNISSTLTAARCWMNPPYGREIGKWVKKAFHATRNGVLVVGLLPARTDTRWFHSWIYNKAEIRFISGRLKFGDSKNSAPFPSMIVIWRNAEEA